MGVPRATTCKAPRRPGNVLSRTREAPSSRKATPADVTLPAHPHSPFVAALAFDLLEHLLHDRHTRPVVSEGFVAKREQFAGNRQRDEGLHAVTPVIAHLQRQNPTAHRRFAAIMRPVFPNR